MQNDKTRMALYAKQKEYEQQENDTKIAAVIRQITYWRKTQRSNKKIAKFKVE